MTVTTPRRPPDVAEIPCPEVTPRAGWLADESLRYDSTGSEIWPASFHPIQKVIVHNTATHNDDPDPAATVRAIYRYHAVERGWGDIGYNFLIDEAGVVYEGRHAFDYSLSCASLTVGSRGLGVAGAHAQGYNSGTVGLALLGTFAVSEPTPAARSASAALIAVIAGPRGIDPTRTGPYVNPVTGTRAIFPEIAAHRDVAETDCPGSALYAALPGIRDRVAASIVAGGKAARAPL